MNNYRYKAIRCAWCGVENEDEGALILDGFPPAVHAWPKWVVHESRMVIVRYFCTREHLNAWRDEEIAVNGDVTGGNEYEVRS